MMKQKNTIRRAEIVRDLTARHYEPGRQDRCKLWVYRNVVSKQYPMSASTFFRYLSAEKDVDETKEDPAGLKQLKLFE
jgi:hypothetical protein